MAADRTAGRRRVTTAAPLDAQCLLTVAVRPDAQLRPMEAVDVRWVPTVAEVELPPTAAEEEVVGVPEVAVADTPQLPVAEAVEVMDAAKLSSAI